MNAAIAVICKAPVPGRVKTRLTPPCTPDEAAALAEAALRDTFAAVCATPATRRVAVLEGRPGTWLPPGVEVIAQRGRNLDERLAGAFDDVGGPALVIGMDTPQVRPALLTWALSALEHAPAVLGAAHDGGYWALGLREPDPSLLLGVPMSTPWTGEVQRRRLRARLGRPPVELPLLHDVDDIASARAVAERAPHTWFAGALAGIDSTAGCGPGRRVADALGR